MGALDQLVGAAGTWAAIYTLQDPASGLDADSSSAATVTPVLDGRFVRLDYTWAYQGAAQAGSLLVGCERASGVASAVWIDSWHNSDRMMICTGTIDGEGAVDVRGTYAAPSGPDWGWRTRLSATPDRLTMTMFNVDPDGREERAVSAEYRRG